MATITHHKKYTSLRRLGFNRMRAGGKSPTKPKGGSCAWQRAHQKNGS